jgi:CHAT domain-containing protein
VGTELFRALFAGEVGNLFYASLAGDHGLRIRIELDPRRPELAPLHDLPWELLYRPDTEEFLCLSRRTPVVRSLHAHREHRPAIAGAAQLRILAYAVNSGDTRTLQLERELRSLEDAWKGSGREVDIVLLRGGGREALRRAFLAGPFHVLHFMGHGWYDEATGQGMILLEGEDGAAQPVGGGELAEELRDFRVRLVVLNGCETARAVGRYGPNPFAGVATAQALSGVPVVVAMRDPIPDAAALAFSRVLYERLASGDPMEAAVTEGRLAIRRLRRGSYHWSTPALFLRGADGRLFAPAPLRWRGSGLRIAATAILGASLAVVLGRGWEAFERSPRGTE